MKYFNHVPTGHNSGDRAAVEGIDMAFPKNFKKDMKEANTDKPLKPKVKKPVKKKA